MRGAVAFIASGFFWAKGNKPLTIQVTTPPGRNCNKLPLMRRG